MANEVLTECVGAMGVVSWLESLCRIAAQQGSDNRPGEVAPPPEDAVSLRQSTLPHTNHCGDLLFCPGAPTVNSLRAWQEPTVTPMG